MNLMASNATQSVKKSPARAHAHRVRDVLCPATPIGTQSETVHAFPRCGHRLC